MLIYFLILLLPFPLEHYFKPKTFRNIMCVLLFLLISLRSLSVGGDLFSYYLRYKEISAFSISAYYEKEAIEPLFIIFCKICSILSKGSFRFFIVMCAALFSFFYSNFIYKISNHQALSWFFTICFEVLVYCLSGLRSSFGLIFGLTSTLYILEPKYRKEKYAKIKFLFYFVLAILFHYSAIIFFFVLIFEKARKKRWYYPAYFIVCILLCLFGYKYIPLLAKFFFPTKEYLFSSDRGYGTLVIISIVWVGIHLLISKKNRKEQFYIAKMLLELVFVTQLLSLYFSLWSRITMFVMILAFIYLPNCFDYQNLFNRKSFKLIVVFICAGLFAYYYYRLTVDSASIVPYCFFWKGIANF